MINLLQALDRISTCMSRFPALDQEMLEEKLLMFFMRMELVRRQHGGNNRHLSFQLHLHESADHGLRDKLMAIQTTIYDQSRTDHCCIATAFSEYFGMQRNFKGACHFKEINGIFAIAALAHFLGKSDATLINNVFVPAGLNESNTTCGFRFDINSLLHDG